MSSSARGGRDLGRFFRGILVVLAAALMILPAFINYESGKVLNLNPVVSMAISLQLFAIGVVVFILAVGKERFEGKRQQQ